MNGEKVYWWFSDKAIREHSRSGSHTDRQVGPKSMGQMTNKVLIVDLGTIAYQEAWELQHRIHEAKQAGMPADVLLLLEHPHVFTLGKNQEGKHPGA